MIRAAKGRNQTSNMDQYFDPNAMVGETTEPVPLSSRGDCRAQLLLQISLYPSSETDNLTYVDQDRIQAWGRIRYGQSPGMLVANRSPNRKT